MGCPSNLDSHPEYQRWLYRRAVEESNSRGMAPEMTDVRFGDEAEADATTSVTMPKDGAAQRQRQQDDSSSSTNRRKYVYRCRRCRTQLGTSAYTIPHQSSSSTTSNPPSISTSITAPSPSQPQTQCAHIFLDPLNWMRPELEQGLISGRLECPNAKCCTVIGRYAWQGMKCSCGLWVVPGLGLARGKIDEVLDRGAGVGVGTGGGRGKGTPGAGLGGLGGRSGGKM